MKKTMITAMTLLFLSNASFAGMLDPKTQENIGSLFESSFFGGIVLAGTFGAGASGLALANSAMVLGITLLADSASSSSIDQEKNVQIIREAINKEATDFQMSGEMGAVLNAGVSTLKTENPELSDNEAVDLLVSSIN